MKFVVCMFVLLSGVVPGCARGGDDGPDPIDEPDASNGALGKGEACTPGDTCRVGLTCVEGVCCSNPDCQGPCSSCKVKGSEGTCVAVPLGQDPENACGDIDCSGYFAGWNGVSCFTQANVLASRASCNGLGKCQTASELCPNQTDLGPAATTCRVCESPKNGTCTGTTPGMCESATGSDQFEPNDACVNVKSIGAVGTNESHQVTGIMQVEPLGDIDQYNFLALESDNKCNTCNGSQTETYRVLIYLQVPPNAGTYRICASQGSCGNMPMQCKDVAAGSSDNALSIDVLDPCGGTNSVLPFFVQVSGITNSHSCQPYGLSFEMITPCPGL